MMLSSISTIQTAAFLLWLCQAVAAYSPGVSHRHIAGLWKLTPKTSSSGFQPQHPRYPIKEFTVYPKDKQRQVNTNAAADINTNNQQPSILLMLKENGQFEQYTEHDQVPEKLSYHKADVLDRYSAFGRLRGNWELIDGKLILAPDRPITSEDDKTSQEDAVLEGEVVAFSEQGLADNPALANQKKKDKQANSDNNAVLDTHLSVPKGRINVGRFMYPKHHPYFFDTPMYNPLQKGKFELKQVLGSLNTRQLQQEEIIEELFHERDFYGKKFWLTSHPLQSHAAKGKKRWSIKYNKYVGKYTSYSCRREMHHNDKSSQMYSVSTFAFC
jgi:hypothetical protein